MEEGGLQEFRINPTEEMVNELKKYPRYWQERSRKIREREGEKKLIIIWEFL